MHGPLRSVRVAIAALLLVGASAPALPSLGERPSAPGVTNASAHSPRFVAYYFHGNVRCATCRKLEAYSEEAITEGFAPQLAAGTLAWRVVNVDEPANKHFVQDFELVTRSLVLVEYRDDEVARFENLRLVWQLVGDKAGFLKYVRDSTGRFLEQG